MAAIRPEPVQEVNGNGEADVRHLGPVLGRGPSEVYYNVGVGATVKTLSDSTPSVGSTRVLGLGTLTRYYLHTTEFGDAKPY